MSDPRPTTAPRALDAFLERVRLHRLANGWTFVLLPRGPAPAISFHTYVDVGAAQEPAGMTGMAHMFEHMAFKGSDRVGTRDWARECLALEREELAYLELRAARAGSDPARIESARLAFESIEDECARCVEGEAFSRVLEAAGGSGSLNASTSADATRYVVSLPADKLELWCWMERERFSRPVLREFYREHQAVVEERRMRVDSNPSGLLHEALLAGAFRAHPYGRPVIGYARDLEGYTRSQAESFRRAQYGARRCTSCLVGDFDPEQVLALLERYFGDLQPGPQRVPAGPAEPAQTEERRVEIDFPASPRLMLAWRVPELTHPDWPAVEIAVRLLGYARSSRLERRLVRDTSLATHVGVGLGTPGNRCPNLALVTVMPSAGSSLDAIESAIDEELARLREHGPTADELAGVKNVARAELLRAMRSNAALAGLLAEYQASTGSWRGLLAELEALGRVETARVQEVLARYFVTANRTVARQHRRAPAAQEVA